MNRGVVEDVFALGHAQEARALLKGFRAELGYFFQLLPVAEGAVLLPVGDNVFGGGCRQA